MQESNTAFHFAAKVTTFYFYYILVALLQIHDDKIKEMKAALRAK